MFGEFLSLNALKLHVYRQIANGSWSMLPGETDLHTMNGIRHLYQLPLSYYTSHVLTTYATYARSRCLALLDCIHSIHTLVEQKTGFVPTK